MAWRLYQVAPANPAVVRKPIPSATTRTCFTRPKAELESGDETALSSWTIGPPSCCVATGTAGSGSAVGAGSDVVVSGAAAGASVDSVVSADSLGSAASGSRGGSVGSLSVVAGAAASVFCSVVSGA